MDATPLISVELNKKKKTCLGMVPNHHLLFQMPCFCSKDLNCYGNIFSFSVKQESPKNQFNLEQNIVLSHSPPVLFLGVQTNKNSVIHSPLLNSRRLLPSSTAFCQSFGGLSKVSVTVLPVLHIFQRIFFSKGNDQI